MKCTIIAGSHRTNSQTSKVAKFIQKEIQTSGLFDETYLLDLHDSPIPFYKNKWKEDEEMMSIWRPIYDEFTSSDAFIVISPEWNGMVPAGLKNVFLLVDHTVLAHKPGLIVTVSSGRGGAFPVHELRTSSYKNSFINYIPMQVIIRHCKEVLNTEEADPENKEDVFYRERLKYSLAVLLEYARALVSVRKSGVIDTEKYPNGMS